MTAPVLAVELEQGIEEGVAEVTSFAPELLGFLVVVIGGTLVAKLLARAAGHALRRVGFDKAVRRSEPGKALSTSTAAPSELVAKAAFAVLVLVVLRLAFAIFGSNPLGDLLADVLGYLPNVLVAMVIVVLATALAAAARDVVATSLRGTDLGGAVATAAGGLVLALGVFAALSQLRVASRIVEGLFHASLALVVGSGIVAIGIGGIPPMRAQWERALRALGQEVEHGSPPAGARSARSPAQQPTATDARSTQARASDGPASHRDPGRGGLGS